MKVLEEASSCKTKRLVEEASLLGIMSNNRYLGLHKLPQSAVKSEERFVPKVARAGWRRGVTVVMVIKWRPYVQNGAVHKWLTSFGFDALETMKSVLFYFLLHLYRQKNSNLQNCE